jgi:hypothetical protein
LTVGSELSEVESEGLIKLREEEKLARDVYLALADEWDVPIFANIAQAESRHMGAVGRLIVKYSLDDPVVDDAHGEFTNPAFAVLYQELVETGSKSLVDAYKVGAMIEEMDIKDLQEVSAHVEHSDIERVYENLTRGSRNHLRAFDAQIEAAGGESYVAQFLTQEQYDAIADSSWETGNGKRGQGQRGRAAPGGQTGDVDELLRGNGRSDDDTTGRHTRDRDGVHDRHRECALPDDQDGNLPQQTRVRDRLFADFGFQRGFRRFGRP